MEKVSIIIPVFNTDLNLLEKCIKSIVSQTYDNIEILVIDDGSKKKVADYCDSLKSLDNRIIVVHQENKGVSEARNNGIKIATGKYIAFIDSDDYIVEKYIENLYKVAENDKSDIVFTSANKIYSNGIEKQKIYEVESGVSLKNNKYKKEFSQYNLDLMGTVWGKLYKKSVIENYKFDSELCFGEDIYFNFRVFNNELSYSYINEYLYQYVINKNSTVRKFNKNALKLYEKTINKIKAYLNMTNDNEKEDALRLWICTFYRVIVMNYICNENNGLNFFEKIKKMRELKKEEAYYDAIQNANLRKLRFSRRLPIILARINCFIVLYMLIEYRNIQYKTSM